MPQESAESPGKTLEYVKAFKLQPLTEALDDDLSGYVSTSEVNNFIQYRPKDWRYNLLF